MQNIFGHTKKGHAGSFQRYKFKVEEYVWRYKIFKKHSFKHSFIN